MNSINIEPSELKANSPLLVDVFEYNGSIYVYFNGAKLVVMDPNCNISSIYEFTNLKLFKNKIFIPRLRRKGNSFLFGNFFVSKPALVYRVLVKIEK